LLSDILALRRRASHHCIPDLTRSDLLEATMQTTWRAQSVRLGGLEQQEQRAKQARDACDPDCRVCGELAVPSYERPVDGLPSREVQRDMKKQ
jgi:hypothetical protein